MHIILLACCHLSGLWTITCAIWCCHIPWFFWANLLSHGFVCILILHLLSNIRLAALGVLELDVYRRCRTVLHKVLCIIKRHLMQTYLSECRFCYRFARSSCWKLCKVHIFKQELTDCNGPFFPWAHWLLIWNCSSPTSGVPLLLSIELMEVSIYYLPMLSNLCSSLTI